VDKVITIPAEPADPAALPPALQPFGAVPPLVSDINLSVDDQMLYVSCWGTGELKQYDVSDPAAPREVGSVHLGGSSGGPRTRRRPRNDSPVARRWSRSAVTGTDLRHQLPLRRLGRPVLSRGRRQLASQDRHGPGHRRTQTRRTLLPTRPTLPRSSRAPGAPARRRRLLRLLLLPLTATAPVSEPTSPIRHRQRPTEAIHRKAAGRSTAGRSPRASHLLSQFDNLRRRHSRPVCICSRRL
jgi:hypothetical protein